MKLQPLPNGTLYAVVLVVVFKRFNKLSDATVICVLTYYQ